MGDCRLKPKQPPKNVIVYRQVLSAAASLAAAAPTLMARLPELAAPGVPPVRHDALHSELKS
ncbi:MAG: hypothetical protein WD738_19320 [Pirellulales bacterium]